MDQSENVFNDDRDPAIRKLVIVGGGTAGWLTALFFSRYLMRRVEIVVVATSTLPPMSVGEATNGPFTNFLNSLGISDADLVRECDATIKIASEFSQWHRPNQGYRWVHEFQPTQTYLGIPMFHIWLRAHRRGLIQSNYQNSCFNTAALVKHCKLPFSGPGDENNWPHGFHFDTNKVIAFLQRRALNAGVQWIDATVSDVAINEGGKISHLLLGDDHKLQGEFFVDCSGFRRIIMDRAYGKDFENFSDNILCDSAVAVTLPRHLTDIRPSTLGTAMESGWIWDIPLSDRTSYGYVYASRFEDDESAESALLRFLKVPRTTPAAKLKWIPGMQKNAWRGNCVCIGVSNSFYEPIESLTSATLTVELRNLLVHFPDRNFNPFNIDKYNAKIRKQCYHTRDFISTHYLTAGRDDSPFWRAVSRECKQSDDVRELINSYPHQAPHTGVEIYDLKAFYGMFTSRGILPKAELPLLDYLDIQPAMRTMQTNLAVNAGVKTTHLSHTAYLKQVVDS